METYFNESPFRQQQHQLQPITHKHNLIQQKQQQSQQSQRNIHQNCSPMFKQQSFHPQHQHSQHQHSQHLQLCCIQSQQFQPQPQPQHLHLTQQNFPIISPSRRNVIIPSVHSVCQSSRRHSQPR